MSEEIRIVTDMTLLLLASGVCSIVFAKIKMPPILGYLAAGIILGPTMFPDLWVETSTVSLLSGIGIVLLMFYIGLETDMTKLRKTSMKLVFVVCFQMPIVVAIGYLSGIMMGFDSVQSIFLGAIISGTSTAVVVGVLKETKHIDHDTAKTIITITIFEDVGQVLILTMAAPLLAGDAPALGSTVNMIMGLILFLGLAIVFGMTLVPRALDYVGRKYSAEILLIVAVGLCFAMATISATMGMSIAIGAFIMGMMISLSKYSGQIAFKVEPVKELFMAVFFISIGLQISPALIVQNIGLAAAIAIVFIVSKIGSVWLGCYLVNITAQKSFVVATSLVAMGEFAFIIAKLALDAGIVTQDFYSAVIGAALITMVFMPLLAKVQPQVFRELSKRTPQRVRDAMARIDGIKLVAANRLLLPSPAKSSIKRGLSLIFVDFMVIVVVMLIFSTLGSPPSSAADPNLNVLPQEILLLLAIVVVSPALHNVHYHIKTIAKALTSLTMGSRRYSKGSEKHIYTIYSNLGNATMFIAFLFLIMLFIPDRGMISLPGLVIIGVTAVIIVYLAWDTIRRGYDKFYALVSKNESEQTVEERPDKV